MSVFRFKQFSVKQERSAMKVGTDAMLLGSLVLETNPRKILDVGAGTGVIALMMAQRFTEAEIVAVEIDAASFLEAQENFQNSCWANRLNAVQCNFLEFHPKNSFDCIVSNPPYYQSRLENNDARKSQARHDSALPMEQMIAKVSELLSDAGSFWVIVPSEVASAWITASSSAGLHLSSNVSILGKEGGTVKRQVLQFVKGETKLTDSVFTVRKLDGSYSDDYIELTQEFHFNQLR
ncbi:MAG: methyltransferase [Crocinitomicaceae bacterium]